MAIAQSRLIKSSTASIISFIWFESIRNIFALLCVNRCVKLGVATATNLSIDQELLEEALKVGGFSTKKDTVNQALKKFIQRRKQQEIIELFILVTNNVADFNNFQDIKIENCFK